MVTITDSSDLLFQWLSCLADPTRLRLLRLLERYELGVGDLCSVVQMPQSTVSRHLKVLTDDRWVTHRRLGTHHLYRMVLDELAPPQRELWRLARENVAQWATLQQDQARLTTTLAARAGKSKSFFANAVGQWDATRDACYGRSLNAEAFLALLPRDWTVADFGCGNGTLTTQLARHVRQAVGIDNSPEMLDAAHAHAGSLDNLTFHEADLTDTPLDDASVDASLCVLVLTYLEDPAAVIREMRRVTRPGGSVVVIDLLAHNRDDFRRQMNQQTNGFTPEVLRCAMNDAALQYITVTPLPTDPQATGPALLLARGEVPHK
jgi:ArsR family transcriptional regulator